MFKAIKYLFMANLYSKAKKNFLILFGSVLGLTLVSLIISDAISVASGMSIYVLLIVKWIFILVFIIMIGYSILKILHIAINPLGVENKNTKKTKEEVLDEKKQYILEKEKIFTKSDLIIQKYMKDKS